MAAGASGNPTDLADKLAAARAKLAALDDNDPKKSVMRTFLDNIDRRLQSPGEGRVPALPDQERGFVGKSETDPRHDARTAAFDAMKALLAAWPRVTNAEKQQRKKQKQRHQAELADAALLGETGGAQQPIM